MKFYDNSRVRRQDRLLDESRAGDILLNGEYGVLAMVEDAEVNSAEYVGAYCIPLNYVWNQDDTIYIHCAPIGHKLDCIMAHPKVSFCVVGNTDVMPNKFTTSYESIVISGRIALVSDDTLRMEALSLFLKKYSPDDYKTGMIYANKSLHRTAVLKLTIEHVSGKAKAVVR